MSLLEVKKLSQGFGDKTLYNDISFEVYKGEHIGIVGDNGVGKSTLVKMLAGEILADKGNVIWQNGVTIGHLDQYANINHELSIINYLKTAFEDLYNLENKMQKLYEECAIFTDDKKLIKASNIQEKLQELDFYSIDSTINKVVTGLGINAIGIDKNINEISGGQRAKVILAKLLLQKPDVLLLDEPTNFLDKEHVDWLSTYLEKFDGTFIVVSHDTNFLERITTVIYNIEFGTIKRYKGKYSDFLRQKEQFKEQYEKDYNAQQKMIKITEEFIRRNIAGVNTKMAQGRRTQLSKITRLEPPKHSKSMSISFKELPISPQIALSIKNLEIGYNYSLLPKLNFKVKGGEKLVIVGFNGIGKSTLLKTIMGIIPSLSGDYKFTESAKIGYYEQDLNWENKELTPIQILSENYPTLTTKEVRKILSKFGIDAKKILQPISTLSGGEQSKVKLCLLSQKSYNFLVLDEISNHFDTDSKKVLKEALINFKGSVILVSHEESFYKDIADKVINIEDFYV